MESIKMRLPCHDPMTCSPIDSEQLQLWLTSWSTWLFSLQLLSQQLLSFQLLSQQLLSFQLLSQQLLSFQLFS